MRRFEPLELEPVIWAAMAVAAAALTATYMWFYP